MWLRPRTLAPRLRELLEEVPRLRLTGPRGAGKRALLRRERGGPSERVELSSIRPDDERLPILTLLPFSWSERQGRAPLRPEELALPAPRRAGVARWTHVAFKGFLPAIHYEGLEPRRHLRWVLGEIVAHEWRELVNVDDLAFPRAFLEQCATQVGQPLNLSAIAERCDITATTARRWLEAFERCHVLFRARAHEESFGRRLVKSPKLYFIDTGILASLLGLRSPEEVGGSPRARAIFENLVAAELLKSRVHRGAPADLTHWRDSNGRRIDLIVGGVAAAIHPDPAAEHDLSLWRKLNGSEAPAVMIHGGTETALRDGIPCRSWTEL